MNKAELLFKYGLGTLLKAILWKAGYNGEFRFTFPILDFEARVSRGSYLYWYRLSKEDEVLEQFVDMVRFFHEYQLVEPGQTILDIGSWMGPASIMFSHLVGKEGCVHAFEPSPEVYDGLIENLDLNESDNVRAHNLAICNKPEEELIFYRSDCEAGGASVKESPHHGDPNVFSSRSTTVDIFCNENDLIPDGMKIDVEGAEKMVLDGAKKTLESAKPWIVIEVHEPFMDEKEAKECWNILLSLNRDMVYIAGEDSRFSYGDDIHIDSPLQGRNNICLLA